MKFISVLALTLGVVGDAFVVPKNECQTWQAARHPSCRKTLTVTGTTTTTSSSTRFFATEQQEQEQEQQLSIDQVTQELYDQKQEFDDQMRQATTVADAEALRRKYLAKKGPINQAMQYMRVLSNQDKPKLGAVVNQIKQEMEATVQERKQVFEVQEIERQMESERIDVTYPGLTQSADIGRRHPLSMTMEKAVDIFTKLGYDTVTGVKDSPEIESDYYCFEALNCPKDHPARDMQDTFYLTNDREKLLRTHTSSVQIRQLAQRQPPLRIVAPGRVYRKDDIDATHSIMFHQVEILALEPRGELHLGHLKGTVEHFLQHMFGPDIQIRYRGSYFPFTEPSMEVDVFFRGKWMEVLGCGMVDPNVLEMAGIDPEEYAGFAAGFGVERFAMVIHGINDLREFYKNDKRFLQQFPHFYDDGMESFLKGETQTDDDDEVEYRTEDVPDPPVDNVEELKERVNGGEEEEEGKQQQDKKLKQTKKQPKQQKQKQQQQKTPPAAASSDIDISKLDIRVGVIQKAWRHPEADKLFCEEIDIGQQEGGGDPRLIASGLVGHYDLDDLQGQRVLVLANLKARKLLGFPSHGMVLCSSKGNKVKFLEPPDDAKIGERVMVDGYDGEPATENQVIKKKMLDKIVPDLKTDSDGYATYKGVRLSTSAGPCHPTLPDAEIG